MGQQQEWAWHTATQEQLEQATSIAEQLCELHPLVTIGACVTALMNTLEDEIPDELKEQSVRMICNALMQVLP